MGLAKPNQLASQSRRNQKRSGNVLIELVFTILPTFALIIAFVNFGMVLYRWSTLQNAVREGCRYAITFQTQTGQGQDASIKAVVQQYAMGIVKTSDSPAHIFVNYYAPTNLNTAIVTGGNLPGNVVEVSVQNVNWSFLAPLAGTYNLMAASSLNLNLYSSDILGGYPVGVTSVTR